MSMDMGMGFGQEQRMNMRPSPSLIQFTEILQMTGLELHDLILQEVAENPALELEEMDPAEGPEELLQRQLIESAQRALQEHDEEEFDVFRTVPDQRSLQEHLLMELAAVLPHEDLPVAEFLVGELDERGFLDTTVARVARSFELPEARVDRVLDALQAVGPLGLGARTVEECLRIQLDRWEEAGVHHPVARAIVTEHLEDLAQGRYSAIASALDVSYDEVIGGRDFIRSHLRPYPIAESTDIAPWQRQTGPGAVAPDVIVRYDAEDRIEIEVTDSRRHHLRLSPAYVRLVATLEPSKEPAEQPGPEPAESLSAEERQHVATQLGRAQRFLSHIRERRVTMLRVATYVMRRQEAFLRRGPRELKPLTRAQVAEALDLHESTISRATAGKYVMLPNRQVVPYATFFKAALSAQDVLRELVEAEESPLTDAELVELMAERGYPLARRTVAKYRKQMGILPSTLR